ncbi:BTB/POZ domain-containing protein 17-like [Amphibalanus amphitrite]|uniref:BTB/POZ domain-containing protein 17-like n=1 Tax=Amphibalanus amphitrite TaxID=1232801 RepID=UPI001C921A57|nr:BTB/POZ domain-containing protein 17-like [Amphibalanus amphitrite]XP_043239919.1 BTB/POZ domain-containing protein 17-like [Amphibalanus amphitrite]
MFQRLSNMMRGYQQQPDLPGTPPSPSHSSEPKEEDASASFEVNSTESVCQRMVALLEQGTMSDVTLLVGAAQYRVHKVVLCASSDVFQVMLSSPNFSDSRQSEVRLQEEPAVAAVFPAMLRFLYSGRITITHSSVLPTLVLADKYNIKDLSKACSEFMCERVVLASQSGLLVSWLQYAITCNQKPLTEACVNFVKWNFETVAISEQFADFDVEVLLFFLQQDDLVVQDEVTLYSHVVRWLEAQERCQPAEVMSALVEEVMLHVRFPMMTPRQLAELLLVPLTSRHKDFFVERMAMGMSFHSGHWERVRELIRTGRPGQQLFTPRVYTDEQWSASLVIDNYSRLPPYLTRTLVFHSPASLSEADRRPPVEWVVDVYPRGVWFRKFYLIVWQGMTEVPELVLRTVRLAFMPRSLVDGPLRFRLAVLIDGVTSGVHHVRTVATRSFLFTEEERLVNFDDLLSFDELNDSRARSPYLLGKDGDVLRLRVVVVPLHDVCKTAS